eukprot:CAMPEP_0206238756 /NCGR_PEP_ID=MMETSP0047_2-20121206/14993_1 /ASSEMBLY_ACC=CAM_ASM_000192 /TAXON_ID=195065 /ORGANISM="Chroomonas mesostigmatica_cf, Strain CCMP1168" /LENGTH=76 /DNA_ID=CAMNT_0053663329 /DNA_START=23 /DNA_END=253 /DNA_ORIENTATION=-
MPILALGKIFNINGRLFMLGAAEDEPWEWKGKKAGVYDNVWDYLTDENKNEKYHYNDPVDPTEYQNEWLGKVITIY